jgi:hypothetical protein
MKILVCYAAPNREYMVAQRLSSAAKEYVEKYFPKGFLEIFWLNTEKQSLVKFLNKEENQDISAVFVPEGMLDVIEIVKKRKIKVEKYGEKDAPVVKSTYGPKTKHLLWQRFEPYLLASFDVVYKVNRQTYVIKELLPEKTKLSELTDVSCEFFKTLEEVTSYINKKAEEEINKLDRKIQELEDQKKLVKKNKEDAFNTINSFE